METEYYLEFMIKERQKRILEDMRRIETQWPYNTRRNQKGLWLSNLINIVIWTIKK